MSTKSISSHRIALHTILLNRRPFTTALFTLGLHTVSPTNQEQIFNTHPELSDCTYIKPKPHQLRLAVTILIFQISSHFICATTLQA